MTFAVSDQELQSLFDLATRKTEVAEQWAALSARQRRAIQDRATTETTQRDAVLGSAKLEVQRYLELEAKLEADKRSVEERLPRAPRWLAFGSKWGPLSSIAAFIGSGVAIGVDILRSGWPSWQGLAARPWLWGPVTATAAIGVLLMLILPALRRRIETQRDASRQSGHDALRIGETEQRISDARVAALRALRDNGMLSLIRAEIGAAVPAFSTTMRIHEAPALTSSNQESLEIETPAHRELRNVLVEWDRGSVGLAGPRGAGKSTLIRSFCRDRWADKDRAGAMLGVVASAPVEYEARDFLLHLFSLVCHRVQEWEATRDSKKYGGLPEQAYDRLAWKHHFTTPQYRPVLDGLLFLERLSNPALMLGVSSLLAAMVLASSAVPTLTQTALRPPAASVPSAAAPTASGAASSAVSSVAVPGGYSAQQGPTTASAAAPASAARAAASSPSPAGSAPAAPSPITLLLRELGINASGLFATGLGLVVYWYAFAMSRRHRMIFRERDRANHSEPHRQQAVRDARYWLAEIKFQHSFSSGWGGAVKLPVGLEASTTLGRSLAQAPLTLPEIVDGFTRFLTLVKNDLNCKVVIGIDELDKLADTDKAQRFLNEIKAIFDVDGVFYLISVSEDAMSQFERRGLPFRDAFDSAFDKIIPADYLRFEDARRLIDERVVGLPIPFQALCFCLSGGLARELVRNCRELVNLAASLDSEPTLATMATALIRRHLDSKLKAVAHAAALLRVEPQRRELLMKVHRLRATAATTAALQEARADLEATSTHNDASIGSEATPLEKLNALIEEIACYVYYLATLGEFFSEALDEKSMEQALRRAEGGLSHIDALASTLQSLAVTPALARSMLDSLRLRTSSS